MTRLKIQNKLMRESKKTFGAAKSAVCFIIYKKESTDQFSRNRRIERIERIIELFPLFKKNNFTSQGQAHHCQDLQSCLYD